MSACAISLPRTPGRIADVAFPCGCAVAIAEPANKQDEAPRVVPLRQWHSRRILMRRRAGDSRYEYERRQADSRADARTFRNIDSACLRTSISWLDQPRVFALSPDGRRLCPVGRRRMTGRLQMSVRSPGCADSAAAVGHPLNAQYPVLVAERSLHRVCWLRGL